MRRAKATRFALRFCTPGKRLAKTMIKAIKAARPQGREREWCANLLFICVNFRSFADKMQLLVAGSEEL